MSTRNKQMMDRCSTLNGEIIVPAAPGIQSNLMSFLILRTLYASKMYYRLRLNDIYVGHEWIDSTVQGSNIPLSRSTKSRAASIKLSSKKNLSFSINSSSNKGKVHYITVTVVEETDLLQANRVPAYSVCLQAGKRGFQVEPSDVFPVGCRMG